MRLLPFALLACFCFVGAASAQDADALIAQSLEFEKKCENIHALINKTGQIYFFSNEKSRRFKVYGEDRYRNFKKGDIFLIAGEGKKSYLRDSKGDLFVPTSEISYSFGKYVSPASEYMDAFRAQLNECLAAISKNEAAINEAKAEINKKIDQLVALLADDSVTRDVFFDRDGNYVITESMEFSTRKNQLADRLWNEIKKLHRDIKSYGSDIHSKRAERETLMKNMKSMESALAAYYKKYPQTRPAAPPAQK